VTGVNAVWDFLGRVFGRESGSGKRAKERLRLVLVHDRSSVAPDVLENLKEDLIAVISRYLEIDRDGLEVDLRRSDESVALVANIPVRQVLRTAERTGR